MASQEHAASRIITPDLEASTRCPSIIATGTTPAQDAIIDADAEEVTRWRSWARPGEARPRARW